RFIITQILTHSASTYNYSIQMSSNPLHLFFFFFNDTATPEIYTLSLHDALPILPPRVGRGPARRRRPVRPLHRPDGQSAVGAQRSEEHTSELQSRSDLVCRLLLEKKKKKKTNKKQKI